MSRSWDKFHPLFGPDLKVAFETTFERGAVPELDPEYRTNNLVHDNPKEPIVRVYEPAVEVLGSCRDGEAAQVIFVPLASGTARYRRLVYTRKFEWENEAPRRWAVAARHGEGYHFGFDSWNSNHGNKYLPLAYIGILHPECFVPVYLKIEDGESFAYLESWAWNEAAEDGRERVVVQARRVSEEEAPSPLRDAKPGTGESGVVYSTVIKGWKKR